MKWVRKCGKSRGWMRSVHGLSPEFFVYLFLYFLEWQVGKSLFVSEAFPKPLLPSSRFWECQQCLLGLVPQHDSWHGWCSAHCWNSEKSTRQLPHFCFCLLTTLQGFELAGLLVCLPVQTCGGKQGGALEAPLVFTLWRCFGIFSVHCVECFPIGRIFLQENLQPLGDVWWHTLLFWNSICCPVLSSASWEWTGVPVSRGRWCPSGCSTSCILHGDLGRSFPNLA